MNPRIATIEDAVAPCEAVRIAVRLGEARDFERPTGLRFVFDQPGASLFAGDHPQRPTIPRDAVRARHAVRNQHLGLPRLGIDTQKTAQSQRRDPELAVHVLDTMAAAAVLARPERNLPVADG